MIQAPLFVAIHLIGLLFALAVGPRHRANLCCAFAYPIGLVLWVTALFAALVFGAPPGGATIVSVYLLLVIALVGVLVYRKGLGRQVLWPVLLWTAGFAAAACLLSSVNVSRFSNDSFTFLVGADVLGTDGLVPLAWKKISSRSLFHPVAHSVADSLGLDYLYAHHVMLAASFVVAFALLLYQGLMCVGADRSVRVAVTSVTIGAMMTIYIVSWHVSYVHANFSTAIYLWTFVALFWFAEVGEQPQALTLSAVAMVGLGLQRMETGGVAAMFLALMLADSRVAGRPAARDFGAAIAVLSSWLVLIAANIRSNFVSPAISTILILALLVPFAYWRSGLWPALRRFIPPIALAAMVLGLAGAIAISPDRMLEALQSTYENLFTIEWTMWGIAPHILVVLAVLGFRAPRFPFDRVFVYGVPLFVLSVLVVGLQNPYRTGWGDSGNRMMMHVVPLFFFYLALCFGPLVRRAPTPRRGSEGEQRC